MPPKRKSNETQEPKLESTYKTTIRFQCPIRGWVEQEVDVKKFKAPELPKGQPIEVETLETENEVN